MANYNAYGEVAVHETLAANVSDNVQINFAEDTELTVVNRTGTAEIYFMVTPGVQPPGTPPVVGDERCRVLPAAMDALSEPISSGPYVISLISASIQAYSVEGI